ncbi:hypothetical protein DMC64_19970 [Amycolatopsis sp. WAC 04197]|uniref:hypothetical protein n=1 Tax=Amycolatopsis sp. WAC 04197 TaxID=2203199 RepID=UPI000F7935AB|nr:hypothetical protein [Amycolatopsis sp. WAC 04197]RSN45125.1 hypothetical protein DMC64_19970 [Amycolatopsis sp. WAC 04197]
MTVTDFTERLKKAEPASNKSSRWLNLVAVLIAMVLVLVVVHVVVILQDETVPALVLARDVGATQPITEPDLVTIELVPDHGIRFVRASDRPIVLGRAPAIGLPKGTLLSASSLIPEGVPGSGFQVVGLRVGAGQRPSQSLWPHAQVCVSRLPEALPCGSSPEKAFLAGVAGVGSPDAGGSLVVDVIVDSEHAQAALAAASGAVIISLIGA